MKQRVMTRYFEDVSVMLTINMMTFVFRLVLGVSLLYFTTQGLSGEVVVTGLELIIAQPPAWLVTTVAVVPGVIGILLIFGLFTRQAALFSLIANVIGSLGLIMAWVQGVNLNGSNLDGQVFDPMMTYLPQMTYNFGFVLLAVFLLVVPVYALEFHSLDGKFFPTPSEKKETDE